MPYAKKQAELREQADPNRKDFFSYIANAKDKDGIPAYRNPREVFSEARVLIVGGAYYLQNQIHSFITNILQASDTTATQLAANTFYLTNNPHTLSRLAEEIRETFDSIEEVRLGEKLDGCRYLHAVINETLRITPSLPGVLPREVLPGGINVVEETFPAGVEVSIPVYALHHNEDFFSAPHSFIPERWLSEAANSDAVKQCFDALTPFSYGSRQCIGKRLAVIELQLTIARTVWRYDLEYVAGGKDDRFIDNPDITEYKILDHMAAGRQGPMIRFQTRHDL
jgi:cytochrome P450